MLVCEKEKVVSSLEFELLCVQEELSANKVKLGELLGHVEHLLVAGLAADHRMVSPESDNMVMSEELRRCRLLLEKSLYDVSWLIK